jgi:hypothetical protein
MYEKLISTNARKTAITATRINTVIVICIVSFLVGHTTLLASTMDSLINPNVF